MEQHTSSYSGSSDIGTECQYIQRMKKISIHKQNQLPSDYWQFGKRFWHQGRSLKHQLRALAKAGGIGQLRGSSWLTIVSGYEGPLALQGKGEA